MTIENENQLINEYNKIVDKGLKFKLGKDALNSLTDNELFIFVAGKSYEYGRPFKSCLENAQTWLNNGRDKIIKSWGYKENDLLGT